jgi:hypothetical protein
VEYISLDIISDEFIFKDCLVSKEKLFAACKWPARVTMSMIRTFLTNLFACHLELAAISTEFPRLSAA